MHEFGIIIDVQKRRMDWIQYAPFVILMWKSRIGPTQNEHCYHAQPFTHNQIIWDAFTLWFTMYVIAIYNRKTWSYLCDTIFLYLFYCQCTSTFRTCLRHFRWFHSVETHSCGNHQLSNHTEIKHFYADIFVSAFPFNRSCVRTLLVYQCIQKLCQEWFSMQSAYS